MEECPCRYCVPPKRNEWCHKICKEYANWRTGMDAKMKKRYQEGEADAVLAEGAKKRKRRHYRRGGKH